MTVNTVGQLSHEHLLKHVTVMTEDGLFTGRLTYVSHDIVRNRSGSCVTIALSTEDGNSLALDTLMYLSPETGCEVADESH